MKFSVPSKDLLAAVDFASMAANTGGIIEAFGGVLLKADETAITASCTDANVFASASAMAEVGERGEALLPLTKIRPYLSALPPCSLDVSLSAGRLVIKSTFGSSRISVLTERPCEAPSVETRGEMDASDMAAICWLAAVAAADVKNESFVVIELDGDQTVAWSTNGKARMSVATCASYSGPSQKILIARRAALDIATACAGQSGNASIAFDENHFAIRAGNRSILCRNVAQKPVDRERFEKLLSFTGDVPVKKSDLQSAIKRAAVLSEKRDKATPLVVLIQPDRITVSSESNVDAAEEIIPCISSGEVRLVMNSALLMDGVSATPGEEVLISYSDAMHPVRITPKSADGWRYYMAGMLPKAAA